MSDTTNDAAATNGALLVPAPRVNSVKAALAKHNLAVADWVVKWTPDEELRSQLEGRNLIFRAPVDATEDQQGGGNSHTRLVVRITAAASQALTQLLRDAWYGVALSDAGVPECLPRLVPDVLAGEVLFIPDYTPPARAAVEKKASAGGKGKKTAKSSVATAEGVYGTSKEEVVACALAQLRSFESDPGAFGPLRGALHRRFASAQQRGGEADERESRAFLRFVDALAADKETDAPPAEPSPLTYLGLGRSTTVAKHQVCFLDPLSPKNLALGGLF